MNNDITLPCGDGIVNLRVGAIIMKDGKLLMVGNREQPEYLYTVGGRIQFGETAEEAVVREVYEETGVHMEIDRAGFVHENLFICSEGKFYGKLFYETAFFFYMKVPADFSPKDRFSDDGSGEFLQWIFPDAPVKYYPEFFRTELLKPSKEVRYIVTDERRSSV